MWLWQYRPGQIQEHPLILAADVALRKGRWPLPERIVLGPPISAGQSNVLESLKLAGAESEFASADYPVFSSTNVGDLWFPLEFKVRRFLTGIPAPDGKRLFVEHFSGTVRQIVTNAGAPPMLRVDGPG
jgi:hypothetical protein